MKKVIIGEDKVKVDDIISVAYGAPVELSESALKRIIEGKNALRKLLEQRSHQYDVSTGVGDLPNIQLNKENTAELQAKIIYSHSAGAGSPLPKEVVRGAMFSRLVSLARGYSGVRPEVANLLVEFLNRDIVPIVPQYGSVGANGDAVLLAHITLTLIGKGNVLYDDRPVPAIVAIRSELLEPLQLECMEGLALINGSQFLVSMGALALHKLLIALKTFLVASSAVTQVLGCSDEPFDEAIHRLRPHPRQNDVAKILKKLLAGSQLLNSTRSTHAQDACSICCLPQIIGPVWNVFDQLQKALEIEINSSTDSQLVLHEENRIVSGGNFHGEPVALWLDFSAIAAAEISNLVERHINRLLNRSLSGLPDFLTKDPATNRGLMTLQYTAADIANENRRLAHPVTVDGSSMRADRDDHVSFGTSAGRKLMNVADNLIRAVSLELLTALQGLDFVDVSRASEPIKKIHKFVREQEPPTRIPLMEYDREPLAPIIENMEKVVLNGKITELVGEEALW